MLYKLYMDQRDLTGKTLQLTIDLTCRSHGNGELKSKISLYTCVRSIHCSSAVEYVVKCHVNYLLLRPLKNMLRIILFQVYPSVWLSV